MSINCCCKAPNISYLIYSQIMPDLSAHVTGHTLSSYKSALPIGEMWLLRVWICTSKLQGSRVATRPFLLFQQLSPHPQTDSQSHLISFKWITIHLNKTKQKNPVNGFSYTHPLFDTHVFAVQLAGSHWSPLCSSSLSSTAFLISDSPQLTPSLVFPI